MTTRNSGAGRTTFEAEIVRDGVPELQGGMSQLREQAPLARRPEAAAIEAEIVGDLPENLRTPELPAVTTAPAPAKFTVTAGMIPGDSEEYEVSPGTTVAQVFSLAQISVGSRTITRNGQATTLETVVEPGDIIMANAAIRGNR